MKIFLFLLNLVFFNFVSLAQVGIGTTNPDPSAELDVFSNDKGLLLPRVALEQTTSFAPLLSHVAGMQVYNTATVLDVIPGLYYNDGSKWIPVGNNAGTKNYAFLRSTDDLPAETIADESVSAYRIGQTVIGNVDKTGNTFYGSSPISVPTPSPAKVAFSVVNQFTGLPSDGIKVAGQFVNLANPPAGSTANDVRAIVGRTFTSPTSNANYVLIYGAALSATHVGTGIVDTSYGSQSQTRNSSTGFGARIVNANGALVNIQNDPGAVIQASNQIYSFITNNGTITTNHGLLINRFGGNTLFGLGNYTNNYGIRVSDQSAGITTNGYGLFLDDVKATNGFGIVQAGSNDTNNFNGNVGIKTLTVPKAELEVAGTGAIIVPIGTTAQRPAVPALGMIRFNSDLGKFEGFNGTTWNALD